MFVKQRFHHVLIGGVQKCQVWRSAVEQIQRCPHGRVLIVKVQVRNAVCLEKERRPDPPVLIEKLDSRRSLCPA